MAQPNVDDLVQLMKDIPDLSLHAGEIGVVRSIWFAPEKAYEVEFQSAANPICLRALLMTHQIMLCDGGQR